MTAGLFCSTCPETYLDQNLTLIKLHVFKPFLHGFIMSGLLMRCFSGFAGSTRTRPALGLWSRLARSVVCFTKLLGRRKKERGPLRTCRVHRRHLHRGYPNFLPYPTAMLCALSFSVLELRASSPSSGSKFSKFSTDNNNKTLSAKFQKGKLTLQPIF